MSVSCDLQVKYTEAKKKVCINVRLFGDNISWNGIKSLKYFFFFIFCLLLLKSHDTGVIINA